jgi:hypothetical protein
MFSAVDVFTGFEDSSDEFVALNLPMFVAHESEATTLERGRFLAAHS